MHAKMKVHTNLMDYVCAGKKVMIYGEKRKASLAVRTYELT